jgi:molybdopterin/thiamine biosynthesis adenylyltransferase/rhodanese-related sulfurtransferase
VTEGYGDLVARAKQRITEIAPADLAARIDDPPLILDIREPYELAVGTIPRSTLVPRGVLEKAMPRVAPDSSAEVVLYCEAGNRSALAAAVLEEMGYRQVASLAGGLTRWKAEGHPVVLGSGADLDRRARYARHLALPEVGEAGQERLRSSRVLVVGAGGLGSPAAFYLAAAGVGTLGVVDHDVVDLSNLQRQILHDSGRIGAPKADSAAMTLERLNPDVTVVPHQTRLEAANVLQIAAGYDAIVDGTDGFPARYLLNDAALHLRVPVVHGSVLRFEGQATVLDPYRGPCYRCLFPAPPPPDLSPSCAEAGVLGAVPGVIGSIQAVETIKLLLGIGDSLAGRLLVYDGLAVDLRVFRLQRDPACPACADESHPPPLVDYDETCTPASH